MDKLYDVIASCDHNGPRPKPYLRKVAAFLRSALLTTLPASRGSPGHALVENYYRETANPAVGVANPRDSRPTGVTNVDALPTGGEHSSRDRPLIRDRTPPMTIAVGNGPATSSSGGKGKGTGSSLDAGTGEKKMGAPPSSWDQHGGAGPAGAAGERGSSHRNTRWDPAVPNAYINSGANDTTPPREPPPPGGIAPGAPSIVTVVDPATVALTDQNEEHVRKGDVPPNYRPVESRSRPGVTVFEDLVTRRRYGSLHQAWRAYQGRSSGEEMGGANAPSSQNYVSQHGGGTRTEETTSNSGDLRGGQPYTTNKGGAMGGSSSGVMAVGGDSVRALRL